MTEGLTVDDLNRLAEKVANVAEEHLFDGVYDSPLDGYDDLYEVHRGLLAVAREVEGLRAEVERLRGYIATSDDDFDWSLVTTAEIAAASDDAVAAMRAERDAAVARADTAERHLTAVHALHRPKNLTTGVAAINGQPIRILSTKTTCAYCSERMVGGYEAVGWPCPTVAAAGPVLVTPPRELGMTADEAAERAAQQEANE